MRLFWIIKLGLMLPGESLQEGSRRLGVRESNVSTETERRRCDDGSRGCCGMAMSQRMWATLRSNCLMGMGFPLVMIKIFGTR